MARWRWFLRLSLGRKLAAATFVPIVGFALVATALFAANQLAILHQDAHHRVRSLAGMSATGLQAIVAFGDMQAARDWADALATVPEMRSIRVLHGDGSVFFEKRLNPHNERPGRLGSFDPFGWSDEVFAAPIVVEREAIARVELVADLSSQWWMVARNMFLLAGLLLGLALVTLALARRLAQLTIDPVTRLAHAMERVSRDGDFATRVARSTSDELGVLVDGFNGMLGQIGERDRALAAYRDGLEREVDARTRDLRRASERLRLAVSAGSLVLWDWDVAHDQVHLSDQWAALAGGPAAEREIAGGQLRALVDPADREEFARTFAETLAGQTVVCDCIARMRPGDGPEARWVRIVGKVIDRDASGRATRMTGILHDVTGSKRREEDLQRARDQAEAASHAKSAFLATMSHEIRTPMNGVLGMTELLLETELDARQRRLGGTIYRSAESLLGIIDDVLDFSKIEAGKLELDAVDFDLHALVGDVIHLFSNAASRKGIVLQSVIDRSTPRAVRGDPLRLRQVLSNLVSNAIKFTDRGSVTLSVAGGGGSEAGREHLRFEVIDTGIGLDAGAQARLFQPFTQVDGSFARRFGGTGLGLAICQRLVALMGGEIRVDSTTGAGARFSFGVWFEPARSEPAVPAGPSDEAPVALAGRVLLAEDNPVNREIAANMLMMFGLSHDIAENGREAFEKVERGGYSAVLMDCQMPEVDGFEATRRIRELERAEIVAGRSRPRVPIIALTANAMAGDRERCLATGMDDYLAKPFKKRELARVLARWLGRAVHADQPAGASESIDLAPADPARSQDETDSPVLDPNVLAGLRRLGGSGGDELLAKLCSLYREDAAQRMQDLHRARAEGDAQALRRAAHSMKSASANVGALGLSELFKTVEHAARDGDVAAAVAVLPDLERRLGEVLAALDQVSRKAA